MADGSIIDNLGAKTFRALTDESQPLSVHTQVADVDKPLLSVAQIVHNGGTVVFSPKGSFVKSPDGKLKTTIEQKGGLYVLKMWIPRDQGSHFTGPAATRP